MRKIRKCGTPKQTTVLLSAECQRLSYPSLTHFFSKLCKPAVWCKRYQECGSSTCENSLWLNLQTCCYIVSIYGERMANFLPAHRTGNWTFVQKTSTKEPLHSFIIDYLSKTAILSVPFESNLRFAFTKSFMYGLAMSPCSLLQPIRTKNALPVQSIKFGARELFPRLRQVNWLGKWNCSALWFSGFNDWLIVTTEHCISAFCIHGAYVKVCQSHV